MIEVNRRPLQIFVISFTIADRAARSAQLWRTRLDLMHLVFQLGPCAAAVERVPKYGGRHASTGGEDRRRCAF